jgi:hypothetical protein
MLYQRRNVFNVDCITIIIVVVNLRIKISNQNHTWLAVSIRTVQGREIR